MKDILLVGIGGFFGSVLRYLTMQSSNLAFVNPPLKTALVNVIGSFLMGVVLFHGSTKLNSSTLLLLVPGFLGGYTTYSSFSGETFSFLKNGQYVIALTYLGLTLLGGLLGVALGFFLSKKIFS